MVSCHEPRIPRNMKLVWKFFWIYIDGGSTSIVHIGNFDAKSPPTFINYVLSKLYRYFVDQFKIYPHK